MFKYYTTGWIPFYCYQFNIGQPPTLFPRDSPHSPPESRRLPSGQHPPDPHLCILMDSFLCIAVGCETIENGNCHRQALVAYAPTTVSAFWSSRIYLSASLYSLTRSALNQHALMFQFGFEANTFYAILRRLRLPRATWFPAFFFSMYNFFSFTFFIALISWHHTCRFAISSSTLLALSISHTPDTLQPGPPTPPPVPSTPDTRIPPDTTTFAITSRTSSSSRIRLGLPRFDARIPVFLCNLRCCAFCVLSYIFIGIGFRWAWWAWGLDSHVGSLFIIDEINSAQVLI